jgi:hypothetical protein
MMDVTGDTIIKTTSENLLKEEKQIKITGINIKPIEIS